MERNTYTHTQNKTKKSNKNTSLENSDWKWESPFVFRFLPFLWCYFTALSSLLTSAGIQGVRHLEIFKAVLRVLLPELHPQEEKQPNHGLLFLQKERNMWMAPIWCCFGQSMFPLPLSAMIPHPPARPLHLLSGDLQHWLFCLHCWMLFNSQES